MFQRHQCVGHYTLGHRGHLSCVSHATEQMHIHRVISVSDLSILLLIQPLLSRNYDRHYEWRAMRWAYDIYNSWLELSQCIPVTFYPIMSTEVGVFLCILNFIHGQAILVIASGGPIVDQFLTYNRYYKGVQLHRIFPGFICIFWAQTEQLHWYYHLGKVSYPLWQVSDVIKTYRIYGQSTGFKRVTLKVKRDALMCTEAFVCFFIVWIVP